MIQEGTDIHQWIEEGTRHPSYQEKAVKIILLKSIHLIMLGILFLSGCMFSPEENQPAIDINELEIPSIFTDWERAHGVARQMDQDSYLSKIYIGVALPGSEMRSKSSVSYRFLSHSNDFVSYNVYCDVLLCRRSQTDHDPDFPVEKTPSITADEILVSARRAYEISINHLSEDYFITEYSTSHLTLMKDSETDNHQIIWLITFYSNYFGEPTYYEQFVVDAESGEVLSIETAQDRTPIPTLTPTLPRDNT